MLQLTSPAFTSGDRIPAVYSCEGDDKSPALRWGGVPEGTAAVALVMDDPDAPRGTFVHWLVVNLPATLGELPASVDLHDLPQDTGASPSEGTNDFGRVGYGGPCPPRGHGPHRYQFRLYALDEVLDLESGFTSGELTDALSGHVLGECQITGTFERKG